jgi:hypothetical protein
MLFSWTKIYKFRACSEALQLPASRKSAMEQRRTFQIHEAKSGKLAHFAVQNAEHCFGKFAEQPKITNICDRRVKKTLESRRPRLVNRSSPPRPVHHRPPHRSDLCVECSPPRADLRRRFLRPTPGAAPALPEFAAAPYSRRSSDPSSHSSAPTRACMRRRRRSPGCSLPSPGAFSLLSWR